MNLMGWVAVAASITVLHRSKMLSIGKTVWREEKVTLEKKKRRESRVEWRLRHNLAVRAGSTCHSRRASGGPGSRFGCRD
jgi:hypothetical protein